MLFPGYDKFYFVVARFLSFLGKVVAVLLGISKFKAKSKIYSILAKNGILTCLRTEGKMCKHNTVLYISISPYKLETMVPTVTTGVEASKYH